MELSIVIPVYNEEKRVINTLNTIIAYFSDKKVDYEIITVNDGSNDDSYKILNDYASVHPQIKVVSYTSNKGKGYAVKQGVAQAHGKYILFSDADLSTPIAEYEHLKKVMNEGFDIVIGSRTVASSKVKIHQPIYRELMGKTFNLFIKMLVISKFNDTQCGFKLFKHEVAKKLFSQQRIKHFAFDVEILYLALKQGYKIKEEGVEWLNSKGSRVSPIKDSIKMLLDLIYIKFSTKIK
jgi:dolichyl-phosphate beta-glucosyltransferase